MTELRSTTFIGIVFAIALLLTGLALQSGANGEGWPLGWSARDTPAQRGFLSLVRDRDILQLFHLTFEGDQTRLRVFRPPARQGIKLLNPLSPLPGGLSCVLPTTVGRTADNSTEMRVVKSKFQHVPPIVDEDPIYGVGHADMTQPIEKPFPSFFGHEINLYH